MLLSQQTQPRFFLVREQTGERVELTGKPLLAGSETGTADYRIAGNTHISRRHAEFVLGPEGCMVTDMGSTNKTYVNDCALTPGTPRPLAPGDRIRLANESFTLLQEA